MGKIFIAALTVFMALPAAVGFADGNMILSRFNLSFPVPTADDLDRGYIETDYRIILTDLSAAKNVTASNRVFYILCEQPFFSPVNFNKPHYHLLCKSRIEPVAKFRPLSLQKTRIVIDRSSMNIDLDFRLKLDWSDPPALYNLEVLFIIE